MNTLSKLCLLLSSLLTSFVCCAKDIRPILQLPLTTHPEPKVRVVVELKGEQWLARIGNGKLQSLGAALEEGERGRVAPLLLADFNYDGHEDIAVLAGTGYGGTISTYWLYLWNPAEQSYKKFNAILGNPSLVPARQAILSWERDGPQWTATEYRVRQGVLATATVREQNALRWLGRTIDQVTIFPPRTGKVTDHRLIDGEASPDLDPEQIPSATAKIGVAKVWLHEQPQTSARTSMCLIKGDRVSLLHYQSSKTTEPTDLGWLLVRFEGKKKLDMWIPAGSIRE